MTPTAGDVHVNTPLTQISIAYTQQASAFVASRVFPNIPVQKQSDRYWTYDRGEFWRDEMQERAPGTESAGGGYSVDSTPTYYAPVYAFHKDIPDQVRNNADAAINVDRDATIYCTTKAMIKREKLWVSKFFAASVWTNDWDGVSGSPSTNEVKQWNDAASTPIEDVRLFSRTVMQSTGYRPNKMVLGRAVYDALLDHPDIIDRLKYGQTVGRVAMTDTSALAALFQVDEILVMDAVENTAKEGQTATQAFIGGKKMLLCYAPAAPGLMVPSAGYTFSWTGHLGAGAEGNRIKQFRMENLASDRVEIEMAFDQKVVSADLGFFLDSAVA